MFRSTTASLRFFSAFLLALPLLLATPTLAATDPTTPKGSTLAGGRQPAASRASEPLAAAAPAAIAEAAAASATVAQPAASLVCLAGTVLGADGLPCPGACVFLVANPHYLVITDAKGSFQLQVPAGTPLSLQADYFGLGSRRIDLAGQLGQPVRFVLGQ